MSPVGKKKVAGRIMEWRTSGQMTFILWKMMIVACIDNREGNYHVILGTPKPCKEYVQSDDFYDALNHVEEYINENPDALLEKINALREGKKNLVNCYEYHVELADLTPVHDMVHCDLLNGRLRNILSYNNKYTLKKLSQITRKEFLEFRNCGNLCADDIHKYLSAVGLDWRMPSPPALESFSDEEIIAECKRRGLSL